MMLEDNPVVTILPVENLKRAMTFYQNILGLRALQTTEMGGYSFVEGNGGIEMILYEREKTKADHTTCAFIVDNIEEKVGELTGKGITFEQYDTDKLKTDEHGIMAKNNSKSAWFKDTEGNILSLLEITEDLELDTLG